MPMLESLTRAAWNPEGGAGAKLLGLCLFPFGLIYGGLWRIRETLPGNPARLPVPVISVGGVTVGGSGKSPVAAEVSRTLLGAGFRTALLSRGYGRPRGDSLVVVSDGRDVLAHAGEAGDEPVMLARAIPDLVVIVCADRARAGRVAIARYGAEVLVLDDGFQNRRLRKDFEIVTVDGRRPFGNGRLLPAGPLRMPASEIARADVVVITKLGADDDPAPLRDALAAQAPGAIIFEGRTVPTEIRDAETGKSLPIDAMRGRRVAAMCGVAEPESFAQLLDREGMEVAGRFFFADHHVYGAGDVRRVREQAHAIAAVITTEKDAVKLDPAWVRGEPPVLVLATRTALDDPAAFERAVRGAAAIAGAGKQASIDA